MAGDVAVLAVADCPGQLGRMHLNAANRPLVFVFGVRTVFRVVKKEEVQPGLQKLAIASSRMAPTPLTRADTAWTLTHLLPCETMARRRGGASWRRL